MKSFHENPTNGSVADKNRGHTDGHGLHISSNAFTSSRTPNKQLCTADKGWSVVLGLGEGLTGPHHKQSAYYKTLKHGVGLILAMSLQEWGAEGDIWVQGGGSNRRLEKTA